VVEKKRRINVTISVELYSKVEKSEYGLTEAVTRGLELLVDPTTRENIEPQVTTQEPAPNNYVLQEIRIQEIQNSNKEIVSNLKNEIDALYKQLDKKDIQIEKLNDTLQNQTINIHSLMQEKKLLSENTKKPWWQFW
jgi:CII-binding regulator of phage lambda lysogenization HflD